ncbi:MAG: hypothetical protein J6S21_06990, partial [Victivallales bacterium]|nr:hypothetical protein [Victivallales bacterium]
MASGQLGFPGACRQPGLFFPYEIQIFPDDFFALSGGPDPDQVSFKRTDEAVAGDFAFTLPVRHGFFGGHFRQGFSCGEDFPFQGGGHFRVFIFPVCVYSVTGKNRVNQTGEETYGMLFFANIKAFENELHCEMECVSLFDNLPTEWTYPLIQPLLIAEF